MFLVNSGHAQQDQGLLPMHNQGKPCLGLNVLVKGTSVGIATGTDGAYSLNASSLRDTLVFSFVRYQSQTVPIQWRTEIDVTLQLQAISGEELVVVGYVAQERETLTGSISRVSGGG